MLIRCSEGVWLESGTIRGVYVKHPHPFANDIPTVLIEREGCTPLTSTFHTHAEAAAEADRIAGEVNAAVMPTWNPFYMGAAPIQARPGGAS